MARRPSDAKAFPRLQLPAAGFAPEAQASVSEFNKNAETIHDQLNGRISLGTSVGAWSGHIDGEIIRVTAPVTGSTHFPVTHNLGRIPVGFLQLSGDGLERSNTSPAHTKSQLWLQNTRAAGTRYLILVF